MKTNFICFRKKITLLWRCCWITLHPLYSLALKLLFLWDIYVLEIWSHAMFDVRKHRLNRGGHIYSWTVLVSVMWVTWGGKAAESCGGVNRPLPDPDSCSMQIYGHGFTHCRHLSSTSNVLQWTLRGFFLSCVSPSSLLWLCMHWSKPLPAFFSLQICCSCSYTVNNRHVINVYM